MTSMSTINNLLASNTGMQTTSTKTDRSQKSDITFQKALENFYEIHQRSQITGVSTFEYNNALKDLGLQKDDALKAIHLLQSNGYTTGAPSIEAILKYGDTPQTTGNHSYMKVAQNVQKDIEKPVNYFDAAQKISAIIPKEETKLTLGEVLKKEMPTSNEEQTSTSDLLDLTQRFLNIKYSSIESNPLSTLLQMI